jgi:hypothetical protein
MILYINIKSDWDNINNINRIFIDIRKTLQMKAEKL